MNIEIRKIYYSDNTVHLEQGYLNNGLHGLSKTFSSFGNLLNKDNYIHGELRGINESFFDLNYCSFIYKKNFCVRWGIYQIKHNISNGINIFFDLRNLF